MSAGTICTAVRFSGLYSVRTSTRGGVMRLPPEYAPMACRVINGMPASEAQDQIGRLQVVAGAVKPYVLDISWEDLDGKIQFQRIPVGH